MPVYFGDIHTHSNFSDGTANPPVVLERAKRHLDFYALTDHAQLPDSLVWGPSVFRGTRFIVQPMDTRWPEIQKLIRENHEPGRFVPFLAYEWSSQQWGDHNVYYLNDDEPIRYARSLTELYASLKGVPAMVIPHHTAYAPHHRGCNWNSFDTSWAPFTEVFSGHGCSERDTGPYPLRGIMGPRCSAGTAQRALELGNVVGFMASTDDHGGYPGMYGKGLCAVIADELTRASLWDAFWKRRVYGVTGDRIHLDFRLNNQMMGSIVHADRRRPRQLQLKIDGWDCLHQVEIVKNNRTVKRWTDFENAPIEGARRLKLGVQWGYYGGPGSNQKTEKRKWWKFAIQLERGEILAHNLHFGPPGANRITAKGSHRRESNPEAEFGSTGLGQMDVEVRGGPETMVLLFLEERLVMQEPISSLMSGNRMVMPFGAYGGYLQLSRPVWEPQFSANLEWEDDRPGTDRDSYYARGTQKNGQMCWSSPIWVTDQVG